MLAEKSFIWVFIEFFHHFSFRIQKVSFLLDAFISSKQRLYVFFSAKDYKKKQVATITSLVIVGSKLEAEAFSGL